MKRVRLLESLTLLCGVGIVLERTSLLLRQRQIFIEMERIEHILITEVCLIDDPHMVTLSINIQVIGSTDVHFHLVFLLKDQTDLTVAFEVRHPDLIDHHTIDLLDHSRISCLR